MIIIKRSTKSDRTSKVTRIGIREQNGHTMGTVELGNQVVTVHMFN